MVNEKKLLEKIESYEKNVNISKNINELTRLPSKYALQSAISEQPQALLYINIDHFDFINSVYGMGKANKLLKATAQRLQKYLPQNAELFHITADEFVILLDNPTTNQALELAKQIQSTFKEAAIEFDDYSQNLAFSIGIAQGVGKILFVNGKAASKESRYFGGDQVTLYNPKSDYMKEQRESLYWIETLKKAFAEDRIVTYYQPIINQKKPDNKHYEVLCRMVEKDGTLIDASKFIKSAKLVGLATHITKAVIDKTFKIFTHNDFSFSLNITMYDLHENYLIDFLEYKCQKYNIAKGRIYLEIVKDIVLAQTQNIDEQILKLKEMGFHIIIDNFGSDALIYERIFDLKAEFIKIDGQLIKDIITNPSHKIIVQSIIDFAQKGGVKIIAEHVETKELYEMIQALGIEYMQGYLLAKPSLKLT